MASLPALARADDEKLDIAAVSAPGTLGAIDQSDAVLHVEVRQALGLGTFRFQLTWPLFDSAASDLPQQYCCF
jgi:hypothetical protein